MDEANRLEVADRDGWRKEYPLRKAIVHIGSDSRNDIVLESAHGAGVAPRHVQLIPVSAGNQIYRLVNMGESDIYVGEKAVSPRSFADVADGERVRLGDFTLTFYGSGGGPVVSGAPAASSGGDRKSSVIGLNISLPQTQLGPNRPIEGYVIVRNLGDKSGVQFKLDVEGLESDCYEIGPGPILFPNAEKQVMFRLMHPRRPSPSAGDYRFSIIATAPVAYPGESMTASQTIRILPYYAHKVRLIPRS